DADNPAAKDAPASDASDETKSEAKSNELTPKEPAGEAAEATDEKGAAPAASSEETTAETKAGKEATAEEQAVPADPFAGGSKTVLTFSQAIGHDAVARRIQDALADDELLGDDTLFEVDNPMYEEGSQRGFQEWTLKIAANADQTAGVAKHVQKALAAEPYFPSSNKVGASVAGNTQIAAVEALLASLVMIIVYVWIRFQLVSFGLSSVLALVHDVLVALGALALSYWLARLPFAEALLIEPFKINLPIIAAFLTIIGYSINDTIVIFDRIREVRGKSQEIGPELVNRCVNETLSRTLLTSLTVFIVVLILYMFGGQGIHGFAFTLVVGTISGTYSTIYIATPLLIWMNRSKSDANKGASGTSRETARV
ncbi:MAG TPA: protein translocase subunit SecF, partial [Pirellulales bacterium]|nr:protein translocase subunit SecF [Pirellulales bacterium]